MTAAAMDEYVERHAPGPVVALHPSVPQTRAALRTALEELRDVSDADMCLSGSGAAAATLPDVEEDAR